jgi:hypothetical protein
MDPGDDLWGRVQHSELNFPALLGENLTKQSCSWKATQLLPAENNSFDHSA